MPEGWNNIEIDLLNNPSLTQSWPENNKGKPMTADDLAHIKEIVIAGNTWNNDSPAVNFGIDDIRVIPADNADADSGSSTKPETPTEPSEPTQPTETPDYSADVANGDPATCPVTFAPADAQEPSEPADSADTSGSSDSANANKPTDSGKPAGNSTAAEQQVASIGAPITMIAAVAAALMVAGAAMLAWARQRKQL
jgi:hypothetical protein